MKNLFFLLLLYGYLCNAQIHDKLGGSWLPEKYVISLTHNSNDNSEVYIFPVQGFEISRSKTLQFYDSYSSEYNSFDTSKMILALFYKSELNTFSAEEVIHEGKQKYRLAFFYSGLNRKYVSKEKVNWYKSADVFLSKSGDKLMLEAIGKGTYEKIYFINAINNYEFKSIEDARKYVLNLQNKSKDQKDR